MSTIYNKTNEPAAYINSPQVSRKMQFSLSKFHLLHCHLFSIYLFTQTRIYARYLSKIQREERRRYRPRVLFTFLLLSFDMNEVEQHLARLFTCTTPHHPCSLIISRSIFVSLSAWKRERNRDFGLVFADFCLYIDILSRLQTRLASLMTVVN
jgi:hypothetical protein